MLSTFETLPDEILMIIFKYSGDIYTILRIFLGLNQRLNRILSDRRLHVLTDFLHINIRDDYYNSEIFQQLLSVNTTINEQKLSQLLQSLISFHIQQKYIQLGYEFQSSIEKFESIREKLTEDEILKIDQELKIQFNSLHNTLITMECLQRIKSLVLTKGARLVCEDYELGPFNLAKAVNTLFLSRIDSTEPKSSISIYSFLQLFQILIISNPSLLNNRDYVGNGGCNVQYFLVFALYRLGYFYNPIVSRPVNMEYYRVTVDMFLFAEQMFERDYDIQCSMFNVLEMISEINNDIFIRTAQWEILKIVVEKYFMKVNEPWDEYLKNRFTQISKHLIENHRFDVLTYIYRHDAFRELFNDSNYIRICVNVMTKDQLGRRYLYMIMENKSLDLLFSKKELIFILLDKKERKLLEKVLKLSPDLIHQLDEDGNDPLLYICLKVNGCRHRIIEFLIEMGSDLERRNFKEQNFMNILQLRRNNKLLQKLVEHEIITNDIQTLITIDEQ